MKLVVVEDDMLLARHYERLLTAAGYDVRLAQHGLAAIDQIDEAEPGVVIVDMLLTGSTIMPLLHELRSHDDLARIPIVMITNIAEQVSLDSLRPYGVKRILDKATMEPSDLVAAVRSVTS